MNWHPSQRQPSEGRFSFQSVTPYPQRRHYWGVPNKNYGFLSSEQLEELKMRVKTEPDEQVYFREKIKMKRQESKKKDSLFYEEDSNCLVHCCTCHNNPDRYLENAQRCKFCKQYKKVRNLHSRNSSSVDRDTIIYNPEDTPTSNFISIADKAVQVELKLPKLRHNNRNSQYCLACKQKRKCKQHAEVESQIISSKLKKGRVKGFSFGNSPKAVNYLTPKKEVARREGFDF